MELVVVIAVVGVLATAIANGIIVVLRNNVAVTTRVTDNRDLLSLATYLPQDVNSAPSSAVVAGDITSGCPSGDVGTGLLNLSWSEKASLANADTYRVSYRVVTDAVAKQSTVKRVACKNGVATVISKVSKALPTFPNGTIPITASLTAAVGSTPAKVVLAVTQHPGETTQRVVQIEAFSKNPALTVLNDPPPPPPPPTLTLSTGSVSAGSTLTASVTLFAPSEVITFYLVDSSSSAETTVGTATADSTGAATGTLSIPLSATNGTGQILASGDAASFAQKTLTVVNGTISMGSAGNTNSVTLAAGSTIEAYLTNFDATDIVSFLLDGNVPLGNPFTVPAQSSKQHTPVVVPGPTGGGYHQVIAVSTLGRRAVSNVLIVSGALSVSPATVAESFPTSAVLYGFKPGEGVQYFLDSSSGVLLASGVTDASTGFITSPLLIPPFTIAGAHTIYAVGDPTADGSPGSQATTTLNVTTAVRQFSVTSATTGTAGGDVALTLQATINGINDTSLNGSDTIAVTGVSNSPNGTAPSAAPTTALFTNGLATISVNVVKAAPTTFLVSDSLRTGSSSAVVVGSAAVSKVLINPTCPAPIGPKWTSAVEAYDTYGNPASGAAVTIGFSPQIGGSSAIASLTSGWTTVASNTSYSSVTDATGVTPSFTANAKKNGGGSAVTVTATSNGKQATCLVSP